jgi:peptidoglycan/xylan/chitin deacetylase (PgdA/CDA1 family)
MFLHHGLTGCDLPDKTVCLTFDDGPGSPLETRQGPRTFDIASYLASRAIESTFFLTGESILRTGALARRLGEMGHGLANHTWSHRSLVNCSPDIAIEEIQRTDDALNGLPGFLRLFRPPFGDWTSALADALNASHLQTYIGPVMWDIDGEDWRYWQNQDDPQRCAERYIRLLASNGRGILLLHDNTAEQESAATNRTFDVVRLLVSWLGANAFHILALPAIPQLRSALATQANVDPHTRPMCDKNAFSVQCCRRPGCENIRIVDRLSNVDPSMDDADSLLSRGS